MVFLLLKTKSSCRRERKDEQVNIWRFFGILQDVLTSRQGTRADLMCINHFNPQKYQHNIVYENL
jgi:hypothetical protein